MRTRKMRLVSALLAVAMMLAIAPVSAFADGETTAAPVEVTVNQKAADDKSGLQLSLEAAGITDFSTVTSLVVTTADGYELGKDDFQFMSGVTVTGNVSHYDENAGLSKLTDIDLTDAKCVDNAIPVRAFDGCTRIKRVILPESLTKIDNWAFQAGYIKDTKTFVTNLEYVGTNKNGQKGDDITFPAGVVYIGQSAFYACENLTGKLVLPATSLSIGNLAFSHSKVAGDIVIQGNYTLANNVNDPGKEAQDNFQETNITSVEFEAGNVKKVPNYFAYGCTLNSIKLSDSIESIGVGAFRYKNDEERTNRVTIAPIVIPKSVKDIYEYAFLDVGDVDSIIVEGEDTHIEASAFAKLSTKIYFKKAVENSGNRNNSTNTAAIWDESTTTILNTDGGEVTPNSAIYNSTGLYTPTKEGYKFLGWYDGETELEGAAEAGKTYTAHWKAKEQYTVAFDLNGQSGTAPATQTVYEGDKATAPQTAPTADGYKFDGWYTDAECTNAFDFGTAIEANTTLYAKWSKALIPVTMKYAVTVEDGTASVKDTDGNEVVKAAETIYVEEGQTVTITANDTIADGMTFDRWEVREGDVQLANERSATTTFTMGTKPVKVAAMPATESDDSWDAATVVTGVAIGAGAAVLTYHIGTELYAEQVLGKGVSVPKTREDVALKAWKLAGKPTVELNGEPLSEAAQAEKWAVESGLMQNDAEGNFNGAKKMNKLKALRVLDKAQKLG